MLADIKEPPARVCENADDPSRDTSDQVDDPIPGSLRPSLDVVPVAGDDRYQVPACEQVGDEPGYCLDLAPDPVPDSADDLLEAFKVGGDDGHDGDDGGDDPADRAHGHDPSGSYPGSLDERLGTH